MGIKLVSPYSPTHSSPSANPSAAMIAPATSTNPMKVFMAVVLYGWASTMEQSSRLAKERAPVGKALTGERAC
jgi:hypothetical protein